MGNRWIEALTLKGPAWGVPAEELGDPKTGLIALVAEATGALAESMSSARTVVSTAHCTAVFEALKAKTRYIKKHYFLVPPLTNEDLVDLGLRPHSTNNTSRRTPVNQPGLEVVKWGPHLLGFRFFTALVVDAAEEGSGIRVHYGLVKAGILPTGEHPSATYLADKTHLLSCPPLVAEDLPDSFFTRRSKDDLLLPNISSGMVCYLSGDYEMEKGGTPGPNGPIIQAFVS
jgi:hypothetical protein